MGCVPSAIMRSYTLRACSGCPLRLQALMMVLYVRTSGLVPCRVKKLCFSLCNPSLIILLMCCTDAPPALVPLTDDLFSGALYAMQRCFCVLRATSGGVVICHHHGGLVP